MSSRTIVRRVLVVDNERTNRDEYAALVLNGTVADSVDPARKRSPFRTEGSVATDGISARTLLEEARDVGQPFDILVTDLYMPVLTGLQLVDSLRSRGFTPEDLHVVLVSREDDAPSLRKDIAAVRERWRGDSDVDLPVVLRAELKTADGVQLHQEEFLQQVWEGVWQKLRAVRRTMTGDSGQEWRSKRIARDSQLIALVEPCIENDAPTNATLLLTGPSGVGNNLLAGFLHQHSRRAHALCLEYSLPNVPDTLVESTLFGHEKGAFTGAATQHIGLIEEAKGGTLFLDEIGEVSPALQTKLLDALERRKFRRLGGKKELSSDFRLIAATNIDIQNALRTNRFRRDLFERLGGDSSLVELPALSARPEDIPLLANHFWQTDTDGGGPKRAGPLPESIGNALRLMPWPGNVRGLLNRVNKLKRDVPADRTVTLTDLKAGEFIDGLSLQQTPHQRTQHIMFYRILLQVLNVSTNKSDAVTNLCHAVAETHSIYFADTYDDAVDLIRKAWTEHKRACRSCDALWLRRW